MIYMILEYHTSDTLQTGEFAFNISNHDACDFIKPHMVNIRYNAYSML